MNAKVTLMRVQVKVTLRVQILCLACCIFFTTRPSLVDFRFQTVLCRSNLLCYLIKVILVDFTLVYISYHLLWHVTLKWVFMVETSMLLLLDRAGRLILL